VIVNGSLELPSRNIFLKTRPGRPEREMEINAGIFRLFYGEQKLKEGIFEIIFAKTQDAKNYLRQQKKRLLSCHFLFFLRFFVVLKKNIVKI
jgi:hypothetical protein